MNSKRRLLIDGKEDKQGRALLVISALYHCRAELFDTTICFLDVDSAAVRGAIDLLRWDSGLDICSLSRFNADNSGSIFEGASLYAAIRLSRLNGLYISEATFFKVPLLFAVQFLPQSATSEQVALLQSAHDPALFAQHLIERMR